MSDVADGWRAARSEVQPRRALPPAWRPPVVPGARARKRAAIAAASSVASASSGGGSTAASGARSLECERRESVRLAPKLPPGHGQRSFRSSIWAVRRQLANNCVYIGRRGAVVKLGLDARHQVARTQARIDKLTQALSKYFGEAGAHRVRSRCCRGSRRRRRPEQRATVQEFDSARQALEADPAVRALREKFGATLLPDSVRPVKPS